MSASHVAEQHTLRISIAMTVVLGVLGIASGLGTGSQAMIFDGMYSFVDVVPSIVSLLVVKLLAQGTSQRFQYGYWHLEPLVMVLRDSILVVACIYAAVGAIKTLSSGGQMVEYGRAAMWAGILCVIGLAMTVFVFRRAKQLQSPMLTVDARSWAMSAILSLSLLIGFAIGAAITRTRYQGWIPYVDSIVLLALAAVMLPVPLMGLWRSMRDVLQIAPGEFDLRVHAVMDSLVQERGFLEYSSYVAKVGRGKFVEIHVLVSAESRIDIAAADAIRREVSDRLNAGTPSIWLTIDFTADRRWL
jgi:predicted Co/Zn/Cd cation transporter (cation efflux family)